MIFNNDDKNTILRAFASESVGDIALRYGVHRRTIEQVIREALWNIAALNQKLIEQQNINAVLEEASKEEAPAS